eukprot:s1337_g9.t1
MPKTSFSFVFWFRIAGPWAIATMSGMRPRALFDPGDDVLPRLRDLVMRCPCAVLDGIRWSVVCKVYTDRYQGGPIGASTLDAAKSSLADLLIFDDSVQGLLRREQVKDGGFRLKFTEFHATVLLTSGNKKLRARVP